MNAKKARSYEKTFEVNAPVEAVWRGITEGEELKRWFCSDATSASSVGGEQMIDWGGGMKTTRKVAIWEPNVHFRTESIRRDKPTVMENGEIVPYAIDWFLEHEGGTTRVRMVASGFGEGAEWDNEYDGTYHGWDLFHKTLKHYLEHHRGEAAENVVIYAMLPVAPAEAWNRLMSPEGLVAKGSPADLSAGAPFSFETSHGDLLAGVVQKFVPGKTFSAVVESLNKSMLSLEMASMPNRGYFLFMSLNTWGMPKDQVDALGSRLKAIVHGLFPQEPA